jgi:hypothetical protein
MRENQTQYRFRRRTASQIDAQNAALASNEKRRHEVGVSLFGVPGAAAQVWSSSSVQLRFTCSLQLR